MFSEQPRCSREKIVRGENPNQSAVVNDGQASHAVSLHDFQSIKRWRCGRNRQRISLHDVAHGQRFFGRRLTAATEQMQQGAMSHQSDQAAVILFDGDMTHVSPLHHTGGEIDQIIRAHREKICRHELAHRLVTRTPIDILAGRNDFPFMHRLALLLLLKHSRRQLAITQIFRLESFHRLQRLQNPTRARLSRLHAFIDNPEVLIDITCIDARRLQSLARKRQQMIANQ